MVALIGPRTGIHKGKHTGNQQRGFMVRHRIRSGKNSARLPVLSLAVAEKQRIRGRVVVSQLACLPHEAAAQHSSVIYMRPGRDDEIITNHPMPDVYRRHLVAVDASVIQTACTTDAAIITDAHILYGTGVQYHYMVPDASYSRSMFVGIKIRDFLHPCNQLRAMAVKRQNIGLVCGEFIINQHLTASRLIQDRHFYPVTELRHTVYQNNIHILNEGVMPYFIIGNVVLDILNATVISHRYIMQRHMPQTGMLPDSSRQHKF